MPETWEHGSDFHWPDFEPVERPADHPWSGGAAAMFGSGRDAMRALLAHCTVTMGWKRVFIPTFFCQEVAASMRIPGLELRTYSNAPGEPPSWPDDLDSADALLLVNFFGLRQIIDISTFRSRGAFVVEDHTHDPWSNWARSSGADFCVVALRKTLPVPEGGVIWSPRGHTLPPEPPVTDERRRAADAKRAAMMLKSLYLSGHPVAKDDFRALFLEGEARIASGEISGITPATRTVLRCFPINAWRQRRKRNFGILSEMLADIAGLRVLLPEGGDCVPFSVIVVAENTRFRETLRAGLIARRIYPAVLWPLNDPIFSGLPAAHVDLSLRIMSLHCDARYGDEDMRRVAKTAAEVFRTE